MSALPPLSASPPQMALQTAPAPDRCAPGPDDIEPVANETLDRFLTGAAQPAFPYTVTSGTTIALLQCEADALVAAAAATYA